MYAAAWCAARYANHVYFAELHRLTLTRSFDRSPCAPDARSRLGQRRRGRGRANSPRDGQHGGRGGQGWEKAKLQWHMHCGPQRGQPHIMRRGPPHRSGRSVPIRSPIRPPIRCKTQGTGTDPYNLKKKKDIVIFLLFGFYGSVPVACNLQRIGGRIGADRSDRSGDQKSP